MNGSASYWATESHVDGFQTVRLENDLLRLEILPELGGRVWTALHKPAGRQWIWHNPGVPLRKVSTAAGYDDHWAGGWEELFPNDAPAFFDGRELPDHGEWWRNSWDWEIANTAGSGPGVRLFFDSALTGTQCKKFVVLSAAEARVTVDYRITNIGPAPLAFLFKEHLAVALSPGDRIELPGGRVTPVDPEFSSLIGGDGPFDWPRVPGRAGGEVDLSVAPPAAEGHREFAYVADLPEGWCGVQDTRTGARLRLYFSRDAFPFTWLFMTYGGWRDLYTVVLEPCTNMPKDLQEAFRRGRCACLAPGGVMECSVDAVFS